MMSEKIILTVEQAKAIDFFKEDETITFDIIAKTRVDNPFHTYYKPFNEMTLDDIVQAVYVGYEVEKPKFEVDDIIVGLKTGNVYKVIDFISLDRMKVTFIYNKSKNPFKKVNVLVMDVRHATKEEIFWAELGREVGEFRHGDVKVYKSGSVSEIGFLSTAKDNYQEGALKGFYPVESFIKFP